VFHIDRGYPLFVENWRVWATEIEKVSSTEVHDRGESRGRDLDVSARLEYSSGRGCLQGCVLLRINSVVWGFCLCFWLLWWGLRLGLSWVVWFLGCQFLGFLLGQIL